MSRWIGPKLKKKSEIPHYKRAKPTAEIPRPGEGGLLLNLKGGGKTTQKKAKNSPIFVNANGTIGMPKSERASCRLLGGRIRGGGIALMKKRF